ncbi:MAG TPA: MFS transporter [Gammaproteobacteria bacterium]|nr:MFS transporter [Gammaproteobacteria bacterium]
MNQTTSTTPNAGIGLAARLGWVSFFNDCSSEVIARALPLFLVTLGMSPTFVGIVEGTAEAISIFLRGFSGWLSDKMTSRKPLIVFGYAFSILSRFALLLAYVPAMLALTRIFDRTGKGLRTAPRDAMVADASALGRAGHAFGITRFLDTLGAVTGILAVLLAGIGTKPLSHNDFQTIVLISIPFGIIALALLIFWVPRLPREVKAKTYLSISIPRQIRVYLAIVFIFALGNSSDAFLVLRAEQIGLSFQKILIIFIFFNLLAALLAIPAGKLSDKFGRIRFLASGWVVYAIVYFGVGLSDSTLAFTGFMFIYGAFYGFTEGIEKALLADLLPADKRGVGYGALQLILGIAALPASFITGYLMTVYGSRVAFPAAGILALCGTIALIIWGRSKKITT